ncbi:MAG: ABC transporter ATP-binding protein [Deltaproteobacteria bacterium]|nr:ABC transporter ATP-binding protein [Deltaproteobacteria bacterium]
MTLQVEDIHTYYGDSYILQGISLEVKAAEIIGVLGRNGMGKTTLIRSVVGLTPPRRGRVRFENTDLSTKEPYEIIRMGIGWVPQGREIFPSLDVTENLTVGFKAKAGGWTLDDIFELFPPLKGRAHHPGNRLSGGEQQMLAIGRSLMTNPTLLLMDEPTEGLSPIYVKTVGDVILRLRDSGISILLVEQNLRFALKRTDFVHILNKGQIVHSSSPEELDANPEIKHQYLGV